MGPGFVWDDIKWFLAVARSRSGHKAAAEFGVSHTTVGRRIVALEGRLGHRLFVREGNSLSLTAHGELAMSHAVRMEEAVQALASAVAGLGQGLAGEVRINATEGLATHWLMPGLAPFLQTQPRLVPNWVTINGTLPKSLYRGAVSVPWWRPEDPNVVARKLGDVTYGLYVGPGYEALNGLPVTIDDLGRHTLMQFNGYELNPGFAPWNALLRRFPPMVRMESTMSAAPALLAGQYMTLLPDYVTRMVPELRRVPLDLGVSLEVWVAYHEEDRQSERIRAVANEIVALARRSRGTWLAA